MSEGRALDRSVSTGTSTASGISLALIGVSAKYTSSNAQAPDFCAGSSSSQLILPG